MQPQSSSPEQKKTFGERYKENMKMQEQFLKNPNKTGKTAIILAVISFFVFPYLGFFATIMGVMGVYYGVQQKAGGKALALNIVAIVLGFSAYLLAQIFVS